MRERVQSPTATGLLIVGSDKTSAKGQSRRGHRASLSGIDVADSGDDVSF